MIVNQRKKGGNEAFSFLKVDDFSANKHGCIKSNNYSHILFA